MSLPPMSPSSSPSKSGYDREQLVAPTLLRSQVFSILYQRVRDGQLEKSEAEAHLDYIRGLRIRLLGDRVPQSVAWKMAAELDWPDTLDAEYVALTKLQADALVTTDAGLRKAASKLVSVVSDDQLCPVTRPPWGPCDHGTLGSVHPVRPRCPCFVELHEGSSLRPYGPPTCFGSKTCRFLAGRKQVLVEVVATSVNLSDWEGLQGSPMYAWIGRLRGPWHRTLGSDIAGRVAAMARGDPVPSW